MMMTAHTLGLQQSHITIDGQDVRGLRCFEANADEGYIRCYFRPVLIDQDGTPRSYTRYGKVVITPPEPDVLEGLAVRFASLVLEVDRGALPH